MLLLLSRSKRALHRPWRNTTRRALRLGTTSPLSKALPKFARTRFAPSPTGYLHLGSLRTALYNFLLAKATGGQFVLRLEDTDKKRTVADAEQRIYQDLKWAGLHWDEGPDIGGPHGPYRQSERTNVYLETAERLLQKPQKTVYRCFCSADRLRDLSSQRGQHGEYNAYDRKCYGMTKAQSAERASKGESYVVRLKTPLQMPLFYDCIYGAVGKNQPKPIARTLHEDPILIKSDGLPTYHLANVVDDHYMNITHVIRGTEWLSSTPKHMHLYKSLGWAPPRYAHVGLLQNNKREKLSKRDDAFGFRSLENEGIFPEVLTNFVALFGWSHKLPTDVFDMQDLIKNFSLKFTKGNAIIEKQKLYFLQKKHAQRYIEAGGEQLDRMISKVATVAEECPKSNGTSLLVFGEDLRARIKSLLIIDPQNYTTPRDFFNRHAPCLCTVSRPPYVPRTDVAASHFNENQIQLISDRIEQVTADDWSVTKLEEVMSELALDVGGINRDNLRADDVREELKLVGNAIGRYLRWALTGGQPGPGIRAFMIFLGRQATLQRLREASTEFNPSAAIVSAKQDSINAFG